MFCASVGCTNSKKIFHQNCKNTPKCGSEAGVWTWQETVSKCCNQGLLLPMKWKILTCCPYLQKVLLSKYKWATCLNKNMKILILLFESGQVWIASDWTQVIDKRKSFTAILQTPIWKISIQKSLVSTCKLCIHIIYQIFNCGLIIRITRYFRISRFQMEIEY